MKKVLLLLLGQSLLLSVSCYGTNQNIFMASIPKSGTHLLLKCLKLLTNKNTQHHFSDWLIIDQKVLNAGKQGKIIFGHAMCSSENIKKLDDNQFKGFFIIRDLRDQIVSMVHYFGACWPTLSLEKQGFDGVFNQLIHQSSAVYGPANWRNPLLLNLKKIDTLYNLWIPWKNIPLIYTTTFEKLVGPQGGGTKEEQIKEIQNIAKHIELTITLDEAKQIANKLFGNSATFREGKIGSWKKHFTEEHKKAFKEVAGQLLIDLGYEKDFDW